MVTRQCIEPCCCEISISNILVCSVQWRVFVLCRITHHWCRCSTIWMVILSRCSLSLTYTHMSVTILLWIVSILSTFSVPPTRSSSSSFLLLSFFFVHLFSFGHCIAYCDDQSLLLLWSCQDWSDAIVWRNVINHAVCVCDRFGTKGV